jgi:GNAT superfamily N-acetyltransferase
MISHHIYLSVALAHKESQMEAARQAHQARSLRRLARTSHPRRSFLSRIASRLGALNYADGHGVGTARYVRDADDPQAAEIAVTVVDDRQGLGAGTELLTQLPGRGRREGIRRSTALVSADKTAMTGLLRNMSAEIAGRDAVEYEIALAAGDQHTPCVQARSSHSTRPAARGDEPR